MIFDLIIKENKLILESTVYTVEEYVKLSRALEVHSEYWTRLDLTVQQFAGTLGLEEHVALDCVLTSASIFGKKESKIVIQVMHLHYFEKEYYADLIKTIAEYLNRELGKDLALKAL